MWNLSKMDINTQSFQSVRLGRSGKVDSNKYPLATFHFKSLESLSRQGTHLSKQDAPLVRNEIRLVTYFSVVL